MLIIIFSLCFLAVVVLTRTYRFVDRYYPTLLYVSSASLLYQLLCRGHLLWHFRKWFFFTDKLSILTQFVVLLPCTVLLFLRYLPKGRLTKAAYFLGFFVMYVGIELCLKQSGEIVYAYGWTFWWSVFMDFCLFALSWIHSKSWRMALPISAVVVVFLMVWFRIPLNG